MPLPMPHGESCYPGVLVEVDLSLLLSPLRKHQADRHLPSIWLEETVMPGMESTCNRC